MDSFVQNPRGRRPQIDDTPIQDFIIYLEKTPADQWAKKADAFEKLVASIPNPANVQGTIEWFSDPRILRHLAVSIGALLKDSRSTLVKRSCETCTQLWNKCGPDARYLLKDIMPVILGIHAQTVQVIRKYVQNMVSEALTKIPCKGAMPLWLERLKTDKSRTVREACAIYLTIGMENWKDDEGYLTTDIWKQVGSGMIRSLRDPSPSTREYVKQGLEIVRTNRPDLWDQVIYDPSGPASKDPKLRRFLEKFGGVDDTNTAADDLSVHSRGSLTSVQSQRSQRSRGGSRYNSGARRGMGPPIRVTAHNMKQPPPMYPPRPKMSNSSEGFQELLKEASQRRTRRSELMQNQWSQILSDGGTQDDQRQTIGAVKVGTEAEAGHHVIARKLLSAHKRAIDGMMEIIRLEMDTLEGFECDLADTNSEKPTEDDVLTYFEALDLCLSKRNTVAKELNDGMDTLSGVVTEEY